MSVSLLKLIRGIELFTGEIVAPVSLGGNSTKTASSFFVTAGTHDPE